METTGREFRVRIHDKTVMHTVEEQAAVQHVESLDDVGWGHAKIQSREVRYGPWEDR